MTKRAAMLVAAFLAGTTVAFAVAPGFAPGRTTRVSVASDGTPASGTVQSGILSRDGRYAVFAANAANLPGANGLLQVYRHDRVTGSTVLASVALGGGGAAASGAFSPSVSGDGRFVAFVSFGADLVPGDGNGALDAFVRDMETGVTRAASTTSDGALTGAGGSLASFAGARTLSDDGRYVVFASTAPELATEPAGGVAQAYRKDLVTGQVFRASVDTAGAAGNAASANAVISGDGRSVAFQTASTNLSPLAPSGAAQVYVRDLAAGTTTLASVGSSGTPSTFFQATTPGLSRDGLRVVFETQATLAAADLDGSWDVYVRDLVAGTTTLASPSPTTAFGVDSREPAISGDGEVVAFRSMDAALVAGDANRTADVFLYALTTGLLTLVSLNDDGVQAAGPSVQPSPSADGTKILFASTAANLVTSPASIGLQLYVRDLATNVPPTVLLAPSATVGFGTTLAASGSFTDPGTAETYTATVDYGDGAGPVALALEPATGGGSFDLTHTYAAAGTYTVVVTVTDSNGGSGSAALVALVRAYRFVWLEPVGDAFAPGRMTPVKFAVYAADGSFVLDTSVSVAVRDAAGAVVAGPYVYGDQPSRSVTIYDASYHVNVDGRGLAAGTYSLVVRFSSPDLTGEVVLGGASAKRAR